jgi:hypothetical protein
MAEKEVGGSLAKRTSSSRVITGALLGLVALFLLAAGVIFLDPFNLHIVDRIRGGYDAAATAIPAESSVYVGIDLLNRNFDELDDFREVFVAATTGTDVDVANLEQRLDDLLARELNLSLEDDLKSWLGQYVGIALVAAELDEFGQLAGFDWVISAESRNRDASDQFLARLAQSWAGAQGESPSSEGYAGISLTKFKQIVFGRSGRFVLLGSSSGALHQAIDAQNGVSLADSDGYARTLAQLPRERLLTAYVNGAQLSELLAAVPTPLPHIGPDNLPTASIEGTALAMSLVKEGLQIDAVTSYNPEKLTLLQETALETRVTDPKTPTLFPADALLMLSGQGIDLFWSTLRRSLIAEIGRSDFDESMRLFEREFSINPDEQLFPYLDGEAALGLIPSEIGTISAAAEIDLGAIAVIGTSDQEGLAASLATFSTRIGNPIGGFGLVTTVQGSSEQIIYEFRTVLIPDLLFAYGTGNGYLMLGSSSEALQSMQFSGGGSLATTSAYQQAVQSFTDEMSVGLFADVQGILDVVGERVSDGGSLATMRALLSPIKYVAAGSQAGEDMAHTRLLIFVPRE